MFWSDPGAGEIRNVHIYDGSAIIHEFNGLFLSGEHRTALDGENTFTLPAPHTVVWGMGISLFFQAAIGIESPVPPSGLIVASAGGDFTV